MNIGLLGTGTWGMALARMLCLNGNDVTCWSALPEEIDQLRTQRKHKNLPGVAIPQKIRFTENIEEACENKEIMVFAVPSVYVRSTAAAAAPFIADGQLIVDVAKGIEPDTLLTMTGVIEDVLEKHGNRHDLKLVALSGPTHAEEVSRDIPTAIVAASRDKAAAETVQNVFTNDCMRVYTHHDVLGVELCGAVKNVMALAAGISSGLGFGDNTKAALITRGMAEIARLGLKMGCDVHTFAGLAGIGDLIVTATSVHSRNNRCGQLIGSGMTPDEAVKQVGMVVEGINALPATMKLSRAYGVEMPIAEAVNNVVFQGSDPREMVMDLMKREKRAEND